MISSAEKISPTSQRRSQATNVWRLPAVDNTADTLTVTAVGPGTATITVTATAQGSAAQTQTFTVTVPEAASAETAPTVKNGRNKHCQRRCRGYQYSHPQYGVRWSHFVHRNVERQYHRYRE